MSSAIESAIRSVVTGGLNAVASFNRKRMATPGEPHPYLTGIHAPLTQEYTLADLSVTGTIPVGLSGRYLRNGPNPVTMPDAASYHWFVGDGMVHGLAIRDGKALWYRNRWVRSADVAAALGEAVPPGPRLDRFDSPNTNVIGHAGRTWAIVEAGGKPVELSHELATIAHNPFDGTLAGPYTAHPHRDPETGELHAICYAGSAFNTVWHTVIDADGRCIREEPIAVQHGPSIHDCALTRHYVLVLDLPVTFSMKAMLGGYRFPYQWNPAHPARVGLLPRGGKGSDIIWVPVAPCYVFHPGNAFEDDAGRVVVDMVVHDTMFAESTRGPDSQGCRLERWTIDPAALTTERRVIHEAPQEFPRYDERRSMQPYRYLYSVAVPPGDGGELAIADTRLYRHDLTGGGTLARDFGPRRHPGEFVFVPRAETGAEDDGWLVGLVVDAARDTSELVIVNADDFLGEPQATIAIPHRIPPGFHGNWVTD